MLLDHPLQDGQLRDTHRLILFPPVRVETKGGKRAIDARLGQKLFAIGRLNVRPEAYVEYFGLNEDARAEEGGGDGFDLDIAKRDGHMLSTVAAVNVGYGFGENGWIRPELRLGWRQNISVDVGDTIARFASGGPDFTLSPASIKGGGPIAGIRLSVGNELGMLSINADAEMIEDYVRYTLLLRASFRF